MPEGLDPGRPDNDPNDPEHREFVPATMDDKNALLAVAKAREDVEWPTVEGYEPPPLKRTQTQDAEGRDVSLARFFSAHAGEPVWTCAIRERVGDGVHETKYFIYFDPDNDFPFNKHVKALTMEDMKGSLDRFAPLSDTEDSEERVEILRKARAESDEQSAQEHAADFALGDPRVSHDEAVELLVYLQSLPEPVPPPPGSIPPPIPKSPEKPPTHKRRFWRS